MLSVTTDPAKLFSVSRCDFADLALLPNGAHVSSANRAHFNEITHNVASRPNREWYGGIADLEAAKRLMTEGWAEGAAQAARLAPRLSNIVTPAKPIRRRVRWADAGAELSIDRALAGDWDHAWRALGTSTNTPRVLSLACSFGGNCNISHGQLFWCAAQMIVLGDLLEAAGYAVELRALMCTTVGHGTRRQVLLDITVKQAHQPLRSDAIAAVFGHAGCYRSFGHMMITTSPFNVGSSLGYHTPIGPVLRSACAAGLTEAPDYVIEHAYTLEVAARNITTALTTLTGAMA